MIEVAESKLKTALRCPCNQDEEDRDSQATGENLFHWVKVRNERIVDYTLQPDGPRMVDEEIDSQGPSLWTVSCESRSEEGPWVQSIWLDEAIQTWLRLWKASPASTITPASGLDLMEPLKDRKAHRSLKISIALIACLLFPAVVGGLRGNGAAYLVCIAEGIGIGYAWMLWYDQGGSQ